jgi:Fanconi anemia group M protein
MFYDIFSKKSGKGREEKQAKKDKNLIIIDNREKNSLVAANLIENHANIKFEQLEIGDYLINNTIIERKTYSDFLSSIFNKRLFKQLEEIKKYPNYFLLIEGNDREITDKLKRAAKGMILSVLLSYKIPILLTKNEEETAQFLQLLANKKEKADISLRMKKTVKDKREYQQFILEGFPGIGPTTAKKLLDKYKILKNIFNASEQELEEILGKKTKDFKEILD